MQIGLGGAANWSANREFADFARPRGNNPESVWQKARAAFNLYPLAARYLISKKGWEPHNMGRKRKRERRPSTHAASEMHALAHLLRGYKTSGGCKHAAPCASWGAIDSPARCSREMLLGTQAESSKCQSTEQFIHTHTHSRRCFYTPHLHLLIFLWHRKSFEGVFLTLWWHIYEMCAHACTI